MNGIIYCTMFRTLFILSAQAIQTSMMQSEGGDTNSTCFKNSCYNFNASYETWNESRRICQGQGGDLVSIETEEEWNFINDTIRHDRGEWWHIGLVRENRSWTWVSGKPLNICKLDDNQLIMRKGTKAAILKKKHLDRFPYGMLRRNFDFASLPYICELPNGNKTSQLYGIL
ncbi:C-type lectin domain family 4 member D-like [Stylophora pistillata]|uniref:C-type lectin domain family 4 member D-like n=1 Tax=Stylophora pistillata TaxID=50429 RepID=UPI000C03B3DC|nr:C-type lectin domain family 4 member D-like [Stylophora pistillata]